MTPPRRKKRTTDLAALVGHLEDCDKFWAGPLADMAHHVRVERDRMAVAFGFCADNPSAPVQVSIRNLDALQAALDAAAGVLVERTTTPRAADDAAMTTVESTTPDHERN